MYSNLPPSSAYAQFRAKPYFETAFHPPPPHITGTHSLVTLHSSKTEAFTHYVNSLSSLTSTSTPFDFTFLPIRSVSGRDFIESEAEEADEASSNPKHFRASHSSSSEYGNLNEMYDEQGETLCSEDDSSRQSSSHSEIGNLNELELASETPSEESSDPALEFEAAYNSRLFMDEEAHQPRRWLKRRKSISQLDEDSNESEHIFRKESSSAADTDNMEHPSFSRLKPKRSEQSDDSDS